MHEREIVRELRLKLREYFPSLQSYIDDNIINVKSEVKKWFTERVNVFALYKHEYYNNKEDLQFKVGLGVKL